MKIRWKFGNSGNRNILEKYGIWKKIAKFCIFLFINLKNSVVILNKFSEKNFFCWKKNGKFWKTIVNIRWKSDELKKTLKFKKIEKFCRFIFKFSTSKSEKFGTDKNYENTKKLKSINLTIFWKKIKKLNFLHRKNCLYISKFQFFSSRVFL